MKMRTMVFGATVIAAASFALGQETQKSLVKSYAALADVILGAKETEAQLVRAILESHRDAAKAKFLAGDYEGAAAEMAMFANEGDNAVGGIRKRLLEGGHHHHADDEAKGIYDAGFVVVTRKAKAAAMATVAALQAATDDAGRKAAWDDFSVVAGSLLK